MNEESFSSRLHVVSRWVEMKTLQKDLCNPLFLTRPSSAEPRSSNTVREEEKEDSFAKSLNGAASTKKIASIGHEIATNAWG